MYHVGQPTHRHHRIRVGVIVSAAVVVIVGIVWMLLFMRPDTVLQQGQITTSQVTIAKPKTKQYKEPTFRIDLPADWAVQDVKTTYTQYSWRGTAKDDTARTLDIYVDNLPANLAVNHMLPIKADGSSIIATDNVSDNCVNFTDKATADPHTGAAPAKWSGLNFLCDTANDLRDVVGTSSTDGVNVLNVTGPKDGTHEYFFVYTDHTAQPDYDLFTTLLTTFQAL